MNLQEKHKEFVIISYANFMQPSDIIDEFIQQFQDEIPQPPPMQQNQDQDEYHYQVEQYWKSIREKLRNQFRRYDINHKEFPKKYWEIYYQAQNEYVSKYINQGTKSSDHIVQELEALYGYVRQCIYGLTPSDKTIRYVQLAHKLLESIAAHKNKTNEC